MKYKILLTLKEIQDNTPKYVELGGVYEHKMLARLGVNNRPVEMQELIDLGHLKTQADGIFTRVLITQAGINAVPTFAPPPPPPPVASPAQLRFEELKKKLSDKTITEAEKDELLKIIVNKI